MDLPPLPKFFGKYIEPDGERTLYEESEVLEWGRKIQRAFLRPCRSPYCECEAGKCTHPGCYDARHLPLSQEG